MGDGETLGPPRPQTLAKGASPFGIPFSPFGREPLFHLKEKGRPYKEDGLLRRFTPRNDIHDTVSVIARRPNGRRSNPSLFVNRADERDYSSSSRIRGFSRLGL